VALALRAQGQTFFRWRRGETACQPIVLSFCVQSGNRTLGGAELWLYGQADERSPGDPPAYNHLCRLR
jgi:hypothetical protein